MLNPPSVLVGVQDSKSYPFFFQILIEKEKLSPIHENYSKHGSYCSSLPENLYFSVHLSPTASPWSITFPPGRGNRNSLHVIKRKSNVVVGWGWRIRLSVNANLNRPHRGFSQTMSGHHLSPPPMPGAVDNPNLSPQEVSLASTQAPAPCNPRSFYICLCLFPHKKDGRRARGREGFRFSRMQKPHQERIKLLTPNKEKLL